MKYSHRSGRLFSLTIATSFFLSAIILFFLFSDQLTVLPSSLNAPLPNHGNDHGHEQAHGQPPEQHATDPGETPEGKENPVLHPEPPSFVEDAFILHPKDHTHRKPTRNVLEWRVTKEMRSPDGVEKEVYLINGQFPGPTIEAMSGDELQVNVFNDIEGDDKDGVAIHWHGLSMRGANDMDGAVGVTQCTIASGQNFTYKFHIEDTQSGTYWYHAHSAVKRADGLFGGLIIHSPSKNGGQSDLEKHGYGIEKLLLVGDWYHKPAQAALDWYQDPDHFGYEPAPDSLLINGRGAYTCSNAVKAWPVKCTHVDPPVMDFADGPVRLRIVNTGAASGFSLSMAKAAMKVITVDGGGTTADAPGADTIGVLYPGQRVDVVATGKPIQMTIIIDEENMPLMNPALTTSQSFPIKWTGGGEEQPPATFDLAGLRGAEQALNIEQEQIEKAVLYTTVQIKSAYHNLPVGSFNHSSWVPKNTSAKPMLALEPSQWSTATKQLIKGTSFNVPHYNTSGQGQWLQLVVNNVDDRGHPFHIHGFSFLVSASGRKDFGRPLNPFNENITLDTKSALQRDTVYIPSRGYVVLYVPLNNSGLWLMHCHVLWHQAVGMGMVMQVGEISDAMRQSAASFCKQ